MSPACNAKADASFFYNGSFVVYCVKPRGHDGCHVAPTAHACVAWTRGSKG